MPCDRSARISCTVFLLTPLREGRLQAHPGAHEKEIFLLTPLREGRRASDGGIFDKHNHFYSRPCGRGDSNFPQVRHEVLRQIAER